MISAAPLLAELFLSAAALVGLWALFRVISSRGAWDPLNRRFLFGIRVTMALFAARALATITDMALFSAVVIIAAAWIPLAVLILTEGLLRRHAPWLAKVYVLGGAALFTLWAVLPIAPEAVRVIALLMFQVGGLIICGALVLLRDRDSLSTSENRTVERLGLSLILLVPFAVVDFLTVKMGVPVRASPVAVLFLCWLGIGLGGTDARHRASVLGFGAVVVAAIAASGFVAVAWSMTWDEAMVAGTVIMAAMLAGSVLNEARHVRAERQSHSLMQNLAHAEGDALTFLRGLQRHPMVEGAAVIEAEALADLDAAVLADIFAQTPVLRRSDLRPEGLQRDYATHLFKRYDASHILWISADPLRLVAVSMPSVAASSATELELAAAQRMAALLAQKAP